MEASHTHADEAMPSWRARLSRLAPITLGVMLVVAIVALLYMVNVATQDHAKALKRQQHSYEVINLVRTLDGTMAKAESTLARYVISMDKNVGLLYQSQWMTAGAQIEALAHAIRANPEERRLVRELRAAYLDRGATLNDIALRTNYKQRMGSLGRFHEAGKAENLKRINAILSRIIDHEMQRLDERSQAVNQSESRSKRLSNTYSLIGLILLIGVLVAIWATGIALRDRRNARAMAEAEAMRADEMEAAVAERTQELEVANDRLRQEAHDRAAAEESLRQMQKMEAVGQLTGGIAHDFNNMLAVVVGGLELAKRKLVESPETAARHLDNAMEGATRASALTRRLLAFARSEPLLPTEVDPDELITGMVDLIDRTIGDQIRVTTEAGAQGWKIWVDRHQLENALLNLAVNARDAMQGRGTITITTGRATLTHHQVGECAAGEYVTLSVRDSGCGMAPDVLSRVFEPFFTTKPRGKGTGLGLSQIFGFVGQCKGEIRILSEVGEGTDVQLFLPRKASRAAARPGDRALTFADPVSADMPPARILVVEDDPRVLSATMAALSELGHLPIACEKPADAAAMLGANTDVGLIISDVLMPDMTGPEMIQGLPERYRAIPVLFVTGFAGDIEDADQFEGHRVLRKPYTLAGLSAAVNAALSGSHRSETAAAAE